MIPKIKISTLFLNIGKIISVIVFLSLLAVPSFASIFADDFESGGFANWNTIIDKYNSNQYVNVSPVNNGTYSANFTINTPYGLITGLRIGGHTTVSKNFTAVSDAYTRFYFYLNNTSTIYAWNNGSYPILLATHILANGSTNSFYGNSVFIWKSTDNSTIYFGLKTYRGQKLRYTYNFSTQAVLNDTWYAVEFRTAVNANGTAYPNGTAQLWVNGNIAFNWTTLNNSDVGNVNQTRIGLDASPADFTGANVLYRNGNVDVRETSYIVNHQSNEGEALYSSSADITGTTKWYPDGKIDIRDTSTASQFFGYPVSNTNANLTDNINAFFDSVVIDTSYIGLLSTSTCTYTSGDWLININDNCTLSTPNTVTGNVYIYGSNGYLNYQANQFAHAFYFNASSLGTWYYNNYRWVY
jgi:hypothetical protein